MRRLPALHLARRAGAFPSRLDETGVRRLRRGASGPKGSALRPLHGSSTESAALEAIPYHVAYREWLEPMSKALREAAALSDDPAFAKFLRMRADALLTDNYFDSDIAWVSLENPKFDVIFAPYETYLDDLLGVKTSYGAAVLIRNDEESRKLDVFQKYVLKFRTRCRSHPKTVPPSAAISLPWK